jgi:hypothetical protein
VNETIRELIIQEFTARAAVIVSTGTPQLYATDIGATVLRARAKVDPDELPCCVINPGQEEAENLHGQSRARMTLTIEALAEIGVVDSSLMAERMLGDLKRAFTSPAWDHRRLVTGPPVSWLPPLAESIIYQGGGTQTLDDGSSTTGATARFVVTYWTAVGDPCTQ